MRLTPYPSSHQRRRALSRTVGIGCCAVLCCAGALGCGLGLIENHSGGAEHLPTQGAGPYSKLETDPTTVITEPFVLTVFRVSVRDPSALWRTGGGYRLWFGYEDDPTVEASEIWYAELANLTDEPILEPERALSADAAWEQGFVGEPSVLERGDGRLVMFYRGGVDVPAIGRADSSDNGQTWTKHASNPIIDGLASPSAAIVLNRATADADTESWLLFADRRDDSGIFQARSEDGIVWTISDQPSVTPRTGLSDAFDRVSVSNPTVTIREIGADSFHYGMFYNATNSTDPDASVSIGWTGSFDSQEWRRFASPDEPILAPGGASEYSPSVLLSPDRGIMFYNELTQGVQGIAAAVHP